MSLSQVPVTGARVLIVDDEQDNRELLKIILGWEGFTCSTAETGQEALSMALSQLPDLILLDLILPDMSGYEIALQLSSNPATKHIPIIAVSGLSDDATRRRALQAGAVELVAKPIDRRALSERIRTALSSKAPSLEPEFV